MNKVYYFLLILLVLASCKDVEVAPKDYPFVIMKEVKSTNDEGLRFVAEVIDLGKHQSVSYGFLWNNTDYKTFSHEVDSIATVGTFSFDLSVNLIEGSIYKVRPYVQTADKMVTGTPIYLNKGF